MSEYHISVLLQESIENLHVTSGKKYIDATLGGGGHTAEIIRSGGIVLGIDADEDAFVHVSEKLASAIAKKKLLLVHGNFKDIDILAKNNGFEEVSGILFDLGISSHQVDEGERGFSFQKEAELDMRMDQKLSVKAVDLVNGLTQGELQELFEKLGEEVFAKRVAQEIVKARIVKPITTTRELAEIAKKGYPRGFHKVHPATKIFQALRIAVNDELNSIRDALPKAMKLLQKNGRLCVISFHSLEDRIVKEAFLDFEKTGIGRIVTDKPVMSSIQEIEQNPRSRSAKLRVIERI